MGYEEFKETLLKLLQEKMGSDVEVTFEMLRKNNGTEVEAVILSGGDSLMPVPHEKDLYELYQQQDGDGGFEACISMIEQLYASTDTLHVERVFKPWEELGDELKSRIMPVLINKKWNQEILKDAVYKEFLDFAVILKVLVLETLEGDGTIRVNKDILNIWEVSENELWDTAFCNLNNERFVVEDFDTVVGKILEDSVIEGVDVPPEYLTLKNELLTEGIRLEKQTDSEKDSLTGGRGVFQYILTNSKRNRGAVGMLRTDLLQEVAEKEGCGLFILPSSVHEVLLLPDRGLLPAEMLKETVGSINQKYVEDEEKLSDNIYYFRKGADRAEVL